MINYHYDYVVVSVLRPCIGLLLSKEVKQLKIITDGPTMTMNTLEAEYSETKLNFSLLAVFLLANIVFHPISCQAQVLVPQVVRNFKMEFPVFH